MTAYEIAITALVERIAAAEQKTQEAYALALGAQDRIAQGLPGGGGLMSDDYVRQMRLRVEKLETTIGIGPGRKTVMEPAEANEAWRRIEALEKSDRNTDELREAADRLIQRVVPIEQRVESWDRELRGLNIFEFVIERDRQARWHATRDAVLPAVYAEATNHGLSVAEVLHDASLHADRAHGPLEAKATSVAELEREHIAKFYYKPNDVEALVKAASDVSGAYWHAGDLQKAVNAMDAARKPFEPEQKP